MKKTWIITVAFCILLVASGWHALRWPRTVPLSQCSEVYRKYVDIEGLSVSFLKDFRINDSVFVDVTLLKADESAAWDRLKKDFGIETTDTAEIYVDSTTVSFKLAPRNDYQNPPDSVLTNNDVIVMHLYERTIAVISIESDEQMEAIFIYHIENTKKQKQK